MRSPSPKIYEVRLETLIRHLHAVGEDPLYWSRQDADAPDRSRAEAYQADRKYEPEPDE